VSEIQKMLEANRAFVSAFGQGDLPARPTRGVAILTCMDARIHPAEALGLDIGDAHVIRNAGGRASDDAIRSLIISSRLLGTTEFAVIQHTDCGMLTLTNAQFQATLKHETGEDASAIDFLPIGELRQSVRDDVERVVSSPFLDPAIEVSGYIYDVHTGGVEQVVAPVAAATA
jgi:carbonic anhydrase